MEPTTRSTPARADASAARHVLILGSRGAGWTSVEALDPATGLALWSYESHRELNAVTAASGRVFVAMCVSHRTDREQPMSIVALRARDGARLWEVDAARVEPRLRWPRLAAGARVALGEFSLRSAWCAMRSLRLSGADSALAAGDDVLCVRANSTLFAFDAASGTLRWVSPSLSASQRNLFGVRSGRVFATGGQGLEALDANTGRLQWRTPHAALPLAFAANTQHVYVLAHAAPSRARSKPSIATLSTADGSHKGLYPLPPHDTFETVRLISDDGVAYLARSESLCAVQLSDGRELWRVPLDGGNAPDRTYPRLYLSPPSAAPRRLIITDTYPRAQARTPLVSALDRASGAMLWRWDGTNRPEPPGSGPAAMEAEEIVFLRDAAATYALTGAEGNLLWRLPHGFTPIGDPLLVTLDST